MARVGGLLAAGQVTGQLPLAGQRIGGIDGDHAHAAIAQAVVGHRRGVLVLAVLDKERQRQPVGRRPRSHQSQLLPITVREQERENRPGGGCAADTVVDQGTVCRKRRRRGAGPCGSGGQEARVRFDGPRTRIEKTALSLAAQQRKLHPGRIALALARLVADRAVEGFGHHLLQFQPIAGFFEFLPDSRQPGDIDRGR